MSVMVAQTIFVAGRRWFQITLSDGPELRGQMIIVMDGSQEWSFDVPLWRPITVGFGSNCCFLWSAREVIRLPKAPDGNPVVETRTDEDLIYVFEHGGGWVLVCESSIRRVLDGRETSRWELSEVTAHVVWRSETLEVTSQGGEEVFLRIDGPNLILVTY